MWPELMSKSKGSRVMWTWSTSLPFHFIPSSRMSGDRDETCIHGPKHSILITEAELIHTYNHYSRTTNNIQDKYTKLRGAHQELSSTPTICCQTAMPATESEARRTSDSMRSAKHGNGFIYLIPKKHLQRGCSKNRVAIRARRLQYTGVH